jgi:hypothetical protein
MSWDSVPWFVGGGAQHSPEVARLLAFAATGGAQGVVTPSDLKVSALAVPGGAVRVAPGAALILSRAAGGSQQTYVARLPEEDVAAVASTGSGAGRSDLIVAQIEDPFMAGEPWQDPAFPAVGPYVFTRVIPNVPAGTRRLQDVPGYEGRTGVALARVDLPGSTGTITAGMITDLRELPAPRTARLSEVLAAAGGTLASQTEVAWPGNALSALIPAWATNVTGTVSINGAQQASGDAYTQHRIRIGSGLYAPLVYVDSDQGTSEKQRVSVVLGIDAQIPPALRGTTQPIAVMSTRNGTDPGRLTLGGGSQLVVDLTWREDVV